MEQFYYQGTAVVENADADCHSLLKASALLRYVEQISSMHARHFGMDDKFFEDHGVAFLVGKQALRFSRVPRRGETLTLCSRSEKGSPRLHQAHHHPYGRSRAGSSHGGQPLDHVQS